MNNGNSMTMDYFRRGFFSRVVSILTTFFFTFVFYLNPATKAMADELTKDEKREAALEALQEATPEQKLSHRLDKLRDKIVLQMPQAKEDKAKHANWLTKAKQAILSDMPVSDDDAKELKKLQASIDSAYQESITNFEKDADTILSNGNGKALSPEAQKLVRERHAQALKSVKEKFKATQDQLAAVIAADSVDTQQQALDTLSKSLAKTQFKRSHTPATPDHLPWGTSEGKVREPVETKQDLHAALGTTPTDNVQLAMAETGSSVASVVMAEALAAATINITTELGESPDVQITPEIRALARSLHNNSTEIYAWVHNNIRFIPSYGSIQGSQYTLETKQGNAIDTASLLIALLRASSIPAHYAYGTVEVPIDQVMNWVGGVTSPLAAQDLLNQGGIPNILAKKNGVFTSFRMEHVWVEAWVDYSPGRGTKAKTGDTWVPMDASFKQHQYSKGIDLKTEVPFDSGGMANIIQAKASINQAEGWIQGFPSDEVANQISQYQAIVKNSLANQSPKLTVGEIVGLNGVKILPPRPLAAGLPYQRIVTSSEFAEVPERLRHKFRYSLSTTVGGYASDPLFVIELPTVKLAGKALGVSFNPSTQADMDLIKSRLPSPELDGGIDPYKLPKTLPGYLIKVNGEFTVDGSVLASAPVGAMGSELREELALWSPKDGWETSVNKPSAGEYRAIGLDLQGISQDQAARLKQRLDESRNAFEEKDESRISALTKHNISGDLLNGTILEYFMVNDLADKVTAEGGNMVSFRLPSFGIFSTKVIPQYWYGIPRNVSFGGLSMDVDHMKQHHVNKDNDSSKRIAFSRTIGSRMSAFEHYVPEQTFSTEMHKAQGISAIKALTIAAQQGQKIWEINQDNMDSALSRISISEDSKADIRNSINAGKSVITHEAQINFNGWVGEGYIINDPLTGGGAYMIAGGGNGGELNTDKLAEELGWSSIISAYKDVPFTGLLLVSTLAVAAYQMMFALKYLSYAYQCHKEAIDAAMWILLLLALAFIVAELASGGVAGVLLFAIAVPSWGRGESPLSTDSGDCSAYCYTRWDFETSACYSNKKITNKAGCKQRAIERRDSCIRNGGQPRDDEVPEWSEDDEQ